MSRCHGSKISGSRQTVACVQTITKLWLGVNQSLISSARRLDKPWFSKYGRKKAKKFTFMTFLPMIALRNKMLTRHSFLPSFDNANDRLFQEEIQNTMVTWRHTSLLYYTCRILSWKSASTVFRERLVDSEMSAANEWDFWCKGMGNECVIKYCTKRFICGIVFITNIPRHLFVCFASNLSNLSQMLKC